MVLCAQIGARRDVDDLGARRHGACGFLRQRRHRQQVDVERAAEVIRADVEELALVEQAGVVDQRGQRRQRGHHCPRGRLIRQIDDAVRHRQPACAQRLGFLLRQRAVAVRHHDAEAIARQALDDGQAQSTCPAGD
ncbi:hypothetical protein G6F50_016693 [Rhizopus delemar]|uniref:Uncharacterized protein n=1 Tax=Rhizopus delemar TaxID=936053 RepID=A0A9P7C1V0_9FUNG|nr:hypothetical protein G6F50_016693 [Rhizopus delemar]